MVWCSLKNNTYYDSQESVLEYNIKNGAGDVIFYGRSVKSPKTAKNKINVSQKIRDYLASDLGAGWYSGSTEIIRQQLDAFGFFTLNQIANEQEVLLETYGFLFDWIDAFDGNDKVLSEPVSGKLDPRMKFFFTRYGETDANFNFELGYNTFHIIFSGGTDFDFQQQQRTLFLEDCTNWGVVSAETTSDWFSVAKNIYGYSSLTIYVEENSGSTQREGTFSLCWPGKYFEPQCNVYDVVQDREHLEITFSGDTNYDYQSGTKTISFTANTEVEAIDSSSWISNISINGTTSGTISFSISGNYEDYERDGYIQFRRKNCSFGEVKQLDIKQKEFVMIFELLDPSQTAITAEYSGRTVSIGVRTNLTDIYFSGTSNWISASYSNQVITLNVDFSTDDDPRIGYLTAYYSADKPSLVTFFVSQGANSEYYSKYLTMIALEDGRIDFQGFYTSGNTDYVLYLDYIKNGVKYSPLQDGIRIYVNAGDKVEFLLSEGNPRYPQTFGNYTAVTHSNSNTIFSSTCKVNLYGNIMSLAYGKNFIGKNDLTEDNISFGGTNIDGMGAYSFLFGREGRHLKVVDASNLILPAITLYKGAYRGLFYYCSELEIAPALPATSLAYECYTFMFGFCSGLTSAPSLPATTLVERCYWGMFEGCKALVNAPVLPATTLAKHCYAAMFDNCISLVSAPSLPATTLKHSCYDGMFGGCKALVNAPELPAKTLEYRCYGSMFAGCRALTTAPVLPAAILPTSYDVNRSYIDMFNGCSSLNYVKCMATSGINSNNSTNEWLKGVSATGTFVKKRGVTWPSGDNGIPSGWTVQEADS